MAEMLEATMLVCFGLSWPINLRKNIKAKTAKSTSLPFILLIITGYLAGILAKFMMNKVNYVLVVYLLNLAIVGANLVVYFINRRYDRITKNDEEKRETITAEKAENNILLNSPVAIPSCHSKLYSELSENRGAFEMKKYSELNHITQPGGIILFGSDFFAALPLGELQHAYHIDAPIYNRSISNVSIDRIQSMMDVCVFDLQPGKIFLNIGDADIKDPDLNVDNFIAKYEWLLYTIHTKTDADLFIVSILSNHPIAVEINQKLQQLAKQNGIHYIDVTPALLHDFPMLRVFEIMKVHLRSHAISFADAMAAGEILSIDEENNSPTSQKSGDYVYSH